MTRRSFLASPAVLAAQSPSNVVRVAVVGVGMRGGYTIQQLAKVPGVEIVAICDLDEERARKAAAGAHAAIFTDYRRMLDTRKDIDAVMIATPVDTHKAITLNALEIGKSVYCEKPMANTEADTRLIVQAARNAKGIFQSGFQLRHDPKRRASMDFIHSGGIGRVLFLQGYRHGGDLPREGAWYFDRSRSGDNIVEQACHILDLFTWVIGKPPLRAMGSGGINLFKDDPPGRTTMDNYAVIYEYPDEVRLSFSHIYFDPPGFTGIKERVFGEKGAIELASATWMERQKRGELKLKYDETPNNADYLSLAAWIDNIRVHKTPLNSAESAARSTLVAMMGRKAIYERRIVTW
jgi:predicted dehydrogenase